MTGRTRKRWPGWRGWTRNCCGRSATAGRRSGWLPAGLRETLRPLVEEVEPLTGKSKEMDRELEQIAGKQYPETVFLRQVSGVGPLIALMFVLTIEDNWAFPPSCFGAVELSIISFQPYRPPTIADCTGARTPESAGPV